MERKERREFIHYLLLFVPFIILLLIPWGVVFGAKNKALLDAISILQEFAFLSILTLVWIIMIKFLKIRTLEEEIFLEEERAEEREIEERATNNNIQKDAGEKQFKSTNWVINPVIILIAVSGIIFFNVQGVQTMEDKTIIDGIGGFFIAVFLWGWYIHPVFTFTEEYLQIESDLLRIFHIGRKKMIKYEDITHVDIERIPRSNYEVYALFISTDEVKRKRFPLPFDHDTIAKMYLLFKEKRGLRVTSLES